MFLLSIFLSLPLRPVDGGPIYAETDLSRPFHEPLNTLSSCLFILLALYWGVTLIRARSKADFLVVCTSILFIGSIGGTLYHGLRRYHFFLFMDYMPIMILCFMAGIYFLFKALRNALVGIGIIVVYFFASFWFWTLVKGQSRQMAINVNYAMLGIVVLVPTLLFLRKINYKEGRWISIALLSFSTALLFRIADGWHWTPFGTHFLWHIFGAVAVASMFNFLYLTQND